MLIIAADKNVLSCCFSCSTVLVKLENYSNSKKDRCPKRCSENIHGLTDREDPERAFVRFSSASGLRLSEDSLCCTDECQLQ